MTAAVNEVVVDPQVHGYLKALLCTLRSPRSWQPVNRSCVPEEGDQEKHIEGGADVNEL